ncbi:MAG: hypothetical protein WA117_11645 [Verrucomicrobiia bacterium]
MKVIEWLKGKKTYFIVAAGFIYGGGIQCGFWDHSAALDVVLGTTAIAALRAGIGKAVVPIVLAGCLLTGCTATDTSGISETAKTVQGGCAIVGTWIGYIGKAVSAVGDAAGKVAGSTSSTNATTSVTTTTTAAN